MEKKKRPKYLKEAQIIFELFENIYKRIESGEIEVRAKMYSTERLMDKIGWGFDYSQRHSLRGILDHQDKLTKIYNIIYSVKTKLEERYPDLIIKNVYGQGYKICIQDYEFKSEINRETTGGIKNIKRAIRVYAVGCKYHPKELPLFYEGLMKTLLRSGNKIIKALPEPIKYEPDKISSNKQNKARSKSA